MVVAVRGYAIPAQSGKEAVATKGKRGRCYRKALPKPSAYSVVFDTETGTDHAQHLRIGTYMVHKKATLIETGIFYGPENISADELSLLQAYVLEKGLTLRTREEFVRDVFYRYGYHYGGLILGFNLPFDLSRIAVSTSTSKGWDMRGGFSLELLPEKQHPNVLVKHLNSKTAFMRFAAAPRAVDGRAMRKKFKTQAKTGYFLDLKTLGAALMGGSFNLKALANLLEAPHRKMATDEHGGPLTPAYLDYAVNDTLATWECYLALQERYAAHGLRETPAHRIYSEASLGKAYLRQAGIQPWRKVQPEFPVNLLGTIMSTYYGGRAEVRIRRQIVRVLYCDFRSMYPTVCTLMGLWRFIIASGIDHQDWTAEASALLDKIDLADLKSPDFWKFLTVLVQVAPDNDIFPVRAPYGGGNRTIGLNYLTSPEPMWFTLANCIASKILTGKVPKIVRAIRFSPREAQKGLRPIVIASDKEEFKIDPYHDDLYRRVIELRGKIQAQEKTARRSGDGTTTDQLAAYSQMLKLLANSTSYGIFAEMNVQSYERPRKVVCHGMADNSFVTGTMSIEEPGSYFHPLLATLITGAARLMLATAERLAQDNSIGWALCDTDSLAAASPEGMADDVFLGKAQAVTTWFDHLNPYQDNMLLFKVEDLNYRLANGALCPGQYEPLYALAISAKRYALFNLDAEGKPVIRKALAHGLGHWLPPYKDEEAPTCIPAPALMAAEAGKPLKATSIGADRWQYDLWHQIIVAELQGHPDLVDLSSIAHLLNRPAASRYAASTPALLHWFNRFNRGKPYANRVKAFNFLLAFQVSPTAIYKAAADGTIDEYLWRNGLPAVVAPFDSNPARARHDCFDRRTGNPVPAQTLATYSEAIADYHLHSEAKFENGNLFDRGITTRRHVEVVAIEYIGKEANRWEEQYSLGEMPGAQIEYGRHPEGHQRLIAALKDAAKTHGVGTLADVAKVSRQQLHAILSGGAQPGRATVGKLCKAMMALARESGGFD
jgi:hypothetical protein